VTTGFIFQNASKGTISHLPQPSRSITIASQVWWTGCQPASANKRLNSIQTLAYFRITWAMHTVLSAMEALICHPQLDLVVQGKVRQGALHTDSWVWGAHPTSTPIKNICCIGHSFKEWIPYLVCRNTQQYFKSFAQRTVKTFFTYSIEITKTFIFNILSFKRPTCECDVKVCDM